MAYINDILLGRITKVSGYEGAVAVKLEKIFTENIPQMESVFLEIEGRPVPFFITDIEYSGAGVLKLQFDGYNSAGSVSGFTGCRVFLTTGVQGRGNKPDHSGLVGYIVYDQDNTEIGSVTDVISNSGQWLLNIDSHHKRNILIPFHEDLIISINDRSRTMVMEIPEGLLEIN